MHGWRMKGYSASGRMPQPVSPIHFQPMQKTELEAGFCASTLKRFSSNYYSNY
jgi:hypothetical protein